MKSLVLRILGSWLDRALRPSPPAYVELSQSVIVVGAGRTAQVRPPAIAARRGVPGENARIAALASPILKLRHR
jgi:hypothetical protein